MQQVKHNFFDWKKVSKDSLEQFPLISNDGLA